MSPVIMQGVSRESLDAARENLNTLVRSGDTDLQGLGGELFSVAAVLDRAVGLRRALTDPARSGDDRAALARSVLAEHMSGAAGDVLVWAVRARWSAPRDLADAVELLAIESVVASAEKANRLDDVEDELFRIGRLVAATPQLRTPLADRSAPVERRVELIEGLLSGRVADETLRLVRQAVTAPRGRSFDHAAELYAEVAAERRRRMVATVTAAVPLTEDQRERLGAALARIYQHKVHLNVEVEPGLVGGIRVEIGDELIEGSVISRLDAARRRLVR